MFLLRSQLLSLMSKAPFMNYGEYGYRRHILDLCAIVYTPLELQLRYSNLQTQQMLKLALTIQRITSNVKIYIKYSYFNNSHCERLLACHGITMCLLENASYLAPIKEKQ